MKFITDLLPPRLSPEMPIETFCWVDKKKHFASYGKSISSDFEKRYIKTGKRLKYTHDNLYHGHKYWGRWEKYHQKQTSNTNNIYTIKQYWRRVCYHNVRFVCTVTIEVNKWIPIDGVTDIIKAFYPSENIEHITNRQNSIVGLLQSKETK